MYHLSIVVVILCSFLKVNLAGDIMIQSGEDQCRAFTSCSSCITKSMCTWCVTKSLCTQQQCGNDNVIYPKNVQALLTGAEFCPRVVPPSEQLTYKHGEVNIFVIKLTQIYLYMAFTPWECRISTNGEDFVIKAVLIGDSIYCEAFEMKNDSDNAYTEGKVKVLWNFNKAFDGSIPFKVCRCDLEPNCIACKKNKTK